MLKVLLPEYGTYLPSEGYQKAKESKLQLPPLPSWKHRVPARPVCGSLGIVSERKGERERLGSPYQAMDRDGIRKDGPDGSSANDIG